MEPAIAIYVGVVKSLIKEETYNKHQSGDKLETCTQEKEFLEKCNTNTTNNLLSLTGLDSLKYHLNLVVQNGDPTCRGCGSALETAKHFLCRCWRLRINIYEVVLTREQSRKVPVSNIISSILGSEIDTQ